MPAISILAGIYTDAAGDFRSALPRNLVPVPKQQGISSGYLRPADGIEQVGQGPGAERGGINWRGVLYRVMGSKLCSVAADGAVTVLGDVLNDAKPVTLGYSADVLGIASAGRLFYWDGTTLEMVTDPDLGAVVTTLAVDGYWMTTDGQALVVTELNDRRAVNPLKYGSAETDPDPIVALKLLRNEVHAIGRHSIEVFQNVGGDLFPFARIPGALIPRGAIGTHAAAVYLGSLAFVGSGRNESPAVWIGASGDTVKLSSREVDQVLQQYTEAELSGLVLEVRTDRSHEHLLLHLPDRCMVYDAAASKAIGEPVWFVLSTSVQGFARYRGRGLVWCYDRWNVADPVDGRLGVLTLDTGEHYGATVGWEFATTVVYNAGADAIVHDMELVALSGNVAQGASPVVWASYSLDGQTWSAERPAYAGQQGQRNARILWRRQGRIGHWRIQRFRGTSDAHLSFARLEAALEPLSAPRRGGRAHA